MHNACEAESLGADIRHTYILDDRGARPACPKKVGRGELTPKSAVASADNRGGGPRARQRPQAADRLLEGWIGGRGNSERYRPRKSRSIAAHPWTLLLTPTALFVAGRGRRKEFGAGIWSVPICCAPRSAAVRIPHLNQRRHHERGGKPVSSRCRLLVSSSRSSRASAASSLARRSRTVSSRSVASARHFGRRGFVL